MTTSPYQHYYAYLSDNVINPFYHNRLEDLNDLNLLAVLKRKNPYLFKAKNIPLPGDRVKGVVDAYLSSQEETKFGNLLEGFAIFVSERLYGGFKSQRRGIDLEFLRNDIYYIVEIKSGPHWANNSQINQMKNNFKLAKEALRQEGAQTEIVAVNGCMYGKESNPFRADADPYKVYYKYCGQEFWNFISEDPDLYREIIVPIDQEARERDEIFKEAYAAKINEMTEDFMRNFMTQHQIDWVKLVDFVSRKE